MYTKPTYREVWVITSFEIDAAFSNARAASRVSGSAVIEYMMFALRVKVVQPIAASCPT